MSDKNDGFILNEQVIYTVYCLLNKVNGKKYIGYSSNVKRRFKEHFDHAFYVKSNEYNTVKSNAIRKHGVENFELIILEEFDNEKEATNREEFYISFFRTNINRFGKGVGYNLTDGGEGTAGSKRSEEFCKKISERVRALPPEFWEHLSKVHKGKRYSVRTEFKKGHNQVLTFEIAEEIRKEYKLGGTSYLKLGNKYNVGHTMIENIIKNRTYLEKYDG